PVPATVVPTPLPAAARNETPPRTETRRAGTITILSPAQPRGPARHNLLQKQKARQEEYFARAVAEGRDYEPAPGVAITHSTHLHQNARSRLNRLIPFGCIPLDSGPLQQAFWRA